LVLDGGEWSALERGFVGPIRASVNTAVKRKIPAPARNKTPVVQPVA